MLKTFPIGGIHTPDLKITKNKAIESMPLPKSVTIPLSQHIGAPATPCVEKGDKVLVGQLIAKAGGFVSANIHSSVSGTVTSVDTFIDSQGLKKPAITIDVEGDKWCENIDLSDILIKTVHLTPEEIDVRILAGGIVGMGGATFPAHVKLAIPEGKRAECLIINGVECEPYLTADHRVMLERGEEFIMGIRVLMKSIKVEKAYIGIENNKPDAISRLRDITRLYPEMEVVALKVYYPQGGEKQLIAAITGREVPSGGLPIDVGVVVLNAGSALAVYEAVLKNKPLVERVVTVTGKCLLEPKNLLVRLGTPIKELIDYCGGIGEDVGKVIIGGPMMGRAISNIDAPVTKGTSGVLLMNKKESLRGVVDECIRCGKCVDACPMGLEPYLLSKQSEKKMYDEAEKHNIVDCIECGCCTFSCPAFLPLLDYLHLGKAEVMKIMRERNSKK